MANGPNLETLRTVHRGVAGHAGDLSEWADLLGVAGWPSFGAELTREAWHLDQVSDRMEAKLLENGNEPG
ncbi:MAG TPA: hypothetical protein VF821_09405 [Lentzea sp.]